MPRKILLVEDAPQVAGILVSKLGREGHSVSWVRTRAEALQAASRGFDLAMLSTDLPEKNAFALLQELKPIPVAMLLQSEEAELKEKALAAGASWVIIKPFKPTIVAKEIREFFAGCEGLPEAKVPA